MWVFVGLALELFGSFAGPSAYIRILSASKGSREAESRSCCHGSDVSVQGMARPHFASMPGDSVELLFVYTEVRGTCQSHLCWI